MAWFGQRAGLCLSRVAEAQFVGAGRLHKIRQTGALPFPSEFPDPSVAQACDTANGPGFVVRIRYAPPHLFASFLSDKHAIRNFVDEFRTKECGGVALRELHGSRHGDALSPVSTENNELIQPGLRYRRKRRIDQGQGLLEAGMCRDRKSTRRNSSQLGIS